MGNGCSYVFNDQILLCSTGRRGIKRIPLLKEGTLNTNRLSHTSHKNREGILGEAQGLMDTTQGRGHGKQPLK